MACAGKKTPAKKKNPKKPTKWPKLRYGNGRCRLCREFDKLKLVPKPDDHDYVYEDDDFEGDEELMLRVIHNRRKFTVAGGFDVDCPPPSSLCVRIYPREHYYYAIDPTLDKNIERSVKFVIDTYNQQKGQKLISLGVLNASVQQSGQCYIFYVTFEGFNDDDHRNDEMKKKKSYVQIYQTMVSFNTWEWRSPDYTIHIFRRSNPTSKDEDLLPPDPSDEETTRVKKELLWTLT